MIPSKTFLNIFPNEKMRIGLLTYHCVPNFGAQLQALSTVGYLRKKGHEPIVLNWYPKDLEDMYRNGRVSQAQISCHDEFTKSMLPVSSLCRTEEELIDEINRLHLDAILLGSDALFKYHSLKEIAQLQKNHTSPPPCEQFEGNPFFGGFLGKLAKRVPAAVYSVSSQDCRYKLMSRMERQQFALAFTNFCFISVRDEWTRKMVEFITGSPNVKIFPDPVFGFNMNASLNLIPSKEDIVERFGLSERYVLLSFSGRYANDTYVKSLGDELEKNGFQPVALPLPELLFGCGIKKCINLPLNPLDWYALIAHSDGFIGERMHPIVVSLHNNVPFFCFDEYGALRKKYFTRKKFWIPKNYVDYRTSKSYHIIKKANLLKNWFSYSKQEIFPSPTFVTNCIIGFDKDRYMSFSERCLLEYQEGMALVLRSLEENLGF